MNLIMSYTTGYLSIVLLFWFADCAITQCHYGNRTYELGERIATDQSCYHCTCTQHWKGTPDYEDCATIDCPWDFYQSRPHCSYLRYTEGECCPVADCGPWNPNFDKTFFGGRRPKISMDNVNLTITVGVEMTLFCMDQTGHATPKTSVTWSKKTLEGEVVPLMLTHDYAGTYTYPQNKNANKKSSQKKNHVWGLYIENSTDDDAGEYICTIHTKPVQIETSFVFIRTKRQKKLKKICFDNQPNNVACKYPVNSNAYFNTNSSHCIFHSTETCAPMGNRFSTMEECSENCWTYTCQGAKPKPSICTNQLLRYYYNAENDTCEPFIYGGCGENLYGNNYHTLKECEGVCQKIKFQVTTRTNVPLKPACEPCPWNLWVHYLYRGCQPKWMKGSCCPAYFKCSETDKIRTSRSVKHTRQTSKSHKCNWDKVSYNIGDKIELKELCQVCICQNDFNGPGSPSCKPKTCESTNAKDILENTTCVPVYSGHSCCPKENFCPPSSIYAQSPPARLHPESSDLHCEFGKMKYPRGFHYFVRDQCLVCKCLTPPQFTCERMLCTYKAEDYCPWQADTECCCSDKTITENSIGAPSSSVEMDACARAACAPNHKCLVNPTLCTTVEHCNPKCELCPAVNCSSADRSLVIKPFRCPECIGPYTPERACEWQKCSTGSTCIVSLRGKSFHRVTCEPTSKNEGILNRYSMKLCNLSCPPNCHHIPSLDSTCPICHCVQDLTGF